MDINSLDRFLTAQVKMYDVALKEIRNGEKESCWMWQQRNNFCLPR